MLNIYCQQYCKDENKEKEVGNGLFFKQINIFALADFVVNYGKIFITISVTRLGDF